MLTLKAKASVWSLAIRDYIYVLRLYSQQLLIQLWSRVPSTHYGWVDRDSVESKVYQTLFHDISTVNQTPDVWMILSPMFRAICHALPHYYHIHSA